MHPDHDAFALLLRHDGGRVGLGVNVEVEVLAFTARDDQVGPGVAATGLRPSP